LKATIGDILNAGEHLKGLTQLSLPAATSLKVARLARRVAEEFQLAVQERNKLIVKYGEDVEGQTKVLPTSKRWPEFVGELNSLLEQEIDLGMEQVKLPDDIEITPAALIALEPFITIE